MPDGLRPSAHRPSGASPFEGSGAPAGDRLSTEPDLTRFWVWGNAPRWLGFVFMGGSLFFLSYVLISLVSGGYGALRTSLGLLGIGLFLVLVAPRFRNRTVDRGRSGWLPVVLVAAMAVVATIFTVTQAGQSEGFALFYFAAFGAAFLRPDRRAVVAIGVITLDLLVSASISLRDVTVAIPPSIEVFFIAFTVYGVGVLRRTNAELHLARHDLARLAVAEERVRIARDLHDTLGHTLTLIALKSELVERLVSTDPDRAQVEAAEVRQAAREALTSVRDTVSGYRQPVLRNELEGVRHAMADAGIDASIDRLGPALPDQVDTVLAWTVREGVTNILRHSGARHAAILVGSDDRSAFAEVTDDGQASAPTRTGSGLAGLAERVVARGGQMEAGPRPEGGFRLKVTVPIRMGEGQRP